MSWAAGWSKRQLITVDSTYIDADLTDFPVLVHLDNTTASGVFDELGASSKKLAIYLTDHSQQCYAEIERWDASGRKAWLWTKIPTVVSGSNTHLYLYYDSSKADNSSYVGTRGSTAGQNVWDDYFLSVFHCNEAPTGADAVKDSTSNNLHLTSYNMESGDLKDAMIGKGLEFDGTNEYAQNSSSQSAYNVTDEVTMEVMFNLSLLATNQKVYALYNGTHHVIMGINASNYLYPEVRTSSGSTYGFTQGPALSTGVNHYYVVSYKNTDGEFYMYSGLTKYSKVTDGNPMSSGNKRLTLGRWSSYEFGGLADEARLSSIKRSDAWLKASYYSNFNNLLNYGAEQLVTSGTLAYGNRLKITIPPTYVDSNLSDFPVLIKLSSSSGLSSFDGTLVFDELASDANRKKIAVTTEDGVSQCFVEIEKWSDSSEEAWLWVKVPSVSASANTTLYLYYDSNVAENTDFVGDIASYAGQQVWTNNFWAVFHMGDTSSPFVSSTITTGLDLNVSGGTPTFATPAKVAEGVDWGSSQVAGQGITGFTASNVTVESWVKQDSAATAIRRYVTLSSEIACIRQDSTGTAQFKFYIKTGGVIRTMTSNNQVDTNWAYWAGTWDGTTQRMYKDASEIGTPNVPGGTLDTGAGMSINSGSENFTGLQDEIRVSTVARTESWLKATYYTCEDNLLYMEEDVIQPGWLGDYDQRIKLTIDHTKIDGSLGNFPILVKVSDNSGITSTDLIAFFNDLTLSSGTYSKSDYEDDFTGTNGDPPDTDKWTETDSDNVMDIQSNKLHFDGAGAGLRTSSVLSRFLFDGNSAFDIQIDFDLITWTTPSSNDNYVRLQIGRISGGEYTWMSRQQGTGGATNRMRLYGNGGTNDSAWNWTGTTGKFRFTWDGTSVLKAYVWTGSQWEWNGNPSGYTCSENFAGDEVYVFLYFEQEATGGDVEATFDNFQINSGHVIYDVNRKKVACTTADGTTQCYTEIEKFDVADEEVFYWVKVPIISNTEDTVLYLYYDVTQPDNTTYVADTGVAPATYVWDENYVGVYHMEQVPTDTIKNSASIGTDGTSGGSMTTSDLVDGKISKSINFDGVDDYINIGSAVLIDNLRIMTIEAIIYPESYGEGSYGRIYDKQAKLFFVVGDGGYPNGSLRYQEDWSSTDWMFNTENGTIPLSQWQHVAMTKDDTDLSGGLLFIQGEQKTLATNTPGTGSYVSDAGNNAYIANRPSDTNRTFDGNIDELRISRVVRSPAWIKASYYTCWDGLISYSAPENPDQFIFQGTVKVQGTPSARKVYLYRRDTGELVSETTSDALSGLFEAGSPYWDYHFFVILPELAETYDLIAHDKIHPEN